MKLACEQALHLGDIVKSGSARGTREEMRKRGSGNKLVPRAPFESQGKARPGDEVWRGRDSFPHGQASYPRASKSLYHSVET